MLAIKTPNSFPKNVHASLFIATKSNGEQTLFAVFSNLLVIQLIQNLSQVISVFDGPNGQLCIASGYQPPFKIDCFNITNLSDISLQSSFTVPLPPFAGPGRTLRCDSLFYRNSVLHGVFRESSTGLTSSTAFFSYNGTTENLTNMPPVLYSLTGGTWSSVKSLGISNFNGTNAYNGLIFEKPLTPGDPIASQNPVFCYAFLSFGGTSGSISIPPSSSLVYADVNLSGNTKRMVRTLSGTVAGFYAPKGAAKTDNGFGFAFTNVQNLGNVILVEDTSNVSLRSPSLAALPNSLTHVWGNGSLSAYDGSDTFSGEQVSPGFAVFSNKQPPLSPSLVFSETLGRLKFTGLTLST